MRSHTLQDIEHPDEQRETASLEDCPEDWDLLHFSMFLG